MNESNPFIFLIDILFDIYIAMLLLRFLLQQVGADFYNPISQFIVKVTQPLVGVARKFIPGFKGMDIATLVLVVIFILIKLIILFTLSGHIPSMIALLVRSIYELIQLCFDIFIFAIFIHAILSWVNPDPYNPVSSLLYTLTAPVLKPVRKYVPPIGGLDLSPLVALIGLMFLKRAVLYIFSML